ncbi:MAG: hypothetical protein ACR2PV_00770 [Gammaproteobacteria bacterium]
MNKDKLQKVIKYFKDDIKNDDVGSGAKQKYYRKWTEEKLLGMSREDMYEFISHLWAMGMWGNKQNRIDQTILKNESVDSVRPKIAELIHGSGELVNRWNSFYPGTSGFGPSMISELLYHVYPNDCIIWNSRTRDAFCFIEIPNLPVYNYQVNGKKYQEICTHAQNIRQEMNNLLPGEYSLVDVNEFIWLLSKHCGDGNIDLTDTPKESGTDEWTHNDIRDKIVDIGFMLGMEARSEVRIAKGARIDAIWEVSIGNMGVVVYAFEVQGKGGSYDSLLMNLSKADNDTAVQGLVAVSDSKGIEKIKNEVDGLPHIKDKIKFWDYQEVLKVHEQLSKATAIINALQLIPNKSYK